MVGHKVHSLCRSVLCFRCALFLAFLSTALCGQKNNQATQFGFNDDTWVLDIPLWVPGFRGQLAYGEFELESDNETENPERERIQDDFGIQFYFAGRAEYWSDDMMISLDIFTGSVGNSFSIKSDEREIDKQFVSFSASGTIPRLTFGYTLVEKIKPSGFGYQITPFIGSRYHNIKLKSDVFEGNEVLNVRFNWFEPVIGVLAPISYKRFQLELFMDMGYASQDISYFLNASINYRITKLVDIEFGWAHLTLTRQDEAASTQFNSRVILTGPAAAVGFHF